MEISLCNTRLSVVISTLGAELISVQDTHGTEYIWQADPQVWKRHAPLLFPYVGRLANDELRYNGQVFENYTQHGFARDSEFEVLRQNETKVELLLSSRGEGPQKDWPTDYELRVFYTLSGNTIEVAFEVRNSDQKDDLRFSLGYHPAFRCPIDSAEEFADYKIAFQKQETAERIILEDGLRAQTHPFLKSQKTIHLSRAQFAQDALIFENLQSNQASLVNQKTSQPAVTVSNLLEWPYLGIWSKTSEEATFVCLEPWCGITDAVNEVTPFEQKQGIIKLAPDEHWSRSLVMEFGSME